MLLIGAFQGTQVGRVEGGEFDFVPFEGREVEEQSHTKARTHEGTKMRSRLECIAIFIVRCAPQGHEHWLGNGVVRQAARLVVALGARLFGVPASP